MASSVDASGLLRASNPRIKRLRRLVSQRKARSEERAFVVEGPAIVAEALSTSAGSSGLIIEGLYLESGVALDLAASATSLDIEVHHVAFGVLGSVLDTVNPQPMAAVISGPTWQLEDLGVGALVILLVDPRDPGNVGTLIRSAEASGAAGLVLAGSAVDPTNPKVLRASAGAGLRLPVVVEPDIDVALDTLAATGRPLLATVVDVKAKPYDQVDLAGAVVALGNETHGLPPSVVERADVVITIPLVGPTESLNLGVAGSMIAFEALRQLRSAQ